MYVILVRHGQTDWNRDDIFRGRIDVKLNMAGLEEAGAVARKLSALALRAVFSSPLSRAMETARRIAALNSVEVEVREDFTDMDFGVWQGLSREEVKTRYPVLFKRWIRAPHKARIPGAETLAGVRRRLEAGLDSLLKEHPEGTVAIVSHGLTNKVALCAVLGLPNSSFWKIKQDNGAINIFSYSREGTKLVLMNDTAHLRTVEQIVAGMKSPQNPLG